jgi:hypothetical protein
VYARKGRPRTAVDGVQITGKRPPAHHRSQQCGFSWPAALGCTGGESRLRTGGLRPRTGDVRCAVGDRFARISSPTFTQDCDPVTSYVYVLETSAAGATRWLAKSNSSTVVDIHYDCRWREGDVRFVTGVAESEQAIHAQRKCISFGLCRRLSNMPLHCRVCRYRLFVRNSPHIWCSHELLKSAPLVRQGLRLCAVSGQRSLHLS